MRNGVLLVRVRHVGYVLVGLSLGLSVASFTMHLLTRAADVGTIAALDVGDEVSLPTWFETLLFLLAALVLLLGAHRARSDGTPARGWTLLAVVMAGLSIDEAVSVHERLGSALRDLLHTSGALYYVWVVPAMVLVGVVALLQLRWWLAFPARTRLLLALAAVVFVGGAAGLEVVAGLSDETEGTATLLSVTLTAVEELLEMVGLSLFVVALLENLAGHRIALEVRSA